jgi:hypothetical protein
MLDERGHMRAMSNVTAVVVTVCALSVTFARQDGVRAQAPRAAFRSGVELIALSVTVSNSQRQYVGDLNRDDFAVFENGVPQTVTFFGKSTAVYADIREELSSQYSLAYESGAGARDGQWRRIAVRVNRPDVIVRTRQGYFAPRK